MEIALTEVERREVASRRASRRQGKPLRLANEAYPSIVKRGGGARSLGRKQGGLSYCLLGCRSQSMGANNMLNTMLEALTDLIQELSGGQALMVISYPTWPLALGECTVCHRF